MPETQRRLIVESLRLQDLGRRGAPEFTILLSLQSGCQCCLLVLVLQRALLNICGHLDSRFPQVLERASFLTRTAHKIWPDAARRKQDQQNTTACFCTHGITARQATNQQIYYMHCIFNVLVCNIRRGKTPLTRYQKENALYKL